MDSSTKRTVIVLVIVVIGLLALFIAGVAHGPGGCAPEAREAWRARLLRSEPVGAGELGGCTTAPRRFTITGRCELRVAPADARSRKLVVEAVDPVALDLVTDADGRRLAMRAELAAGERKEIFVGQDGQVIGIACRAGVTCRAGVAGSSE